ncbi:MFS transporter [Streptomyces sp. NPDC054784]
MLAAFAFNTAENLPVGLLEPVSADLRVPVPAVGLLVSGYALTVAVASLPLTHAVRAVPRRHVLTGVLAALVGSGLAASLASSYGQLLAARVATALAQALFWAVLGPVAVGLFPSGVRGRVVGALSVAGSLALVAGVPAGTWLGRVADWRLSVAVPAVLGLVPLVLVAALLPTAAPGAERAAYGTRPDARRFRTVLAAGALSATGGFAGFTYVVPFLGDVSGFAPDAVALLLVAFGVACLAGTGVAGALLDRFPDAVLPAAVAAQGAGLLGLWAAGGRPAAAVVFLLVTGGALGPVFLAAQHAVLRCAPGRTDLALAANSGAYHAGMAAGAALGALALPYAGVRGAFLLGGLLGAASCTVLLADRRPRARA